MVKALNIIAYVLLAFILLVIVTGIMAQDDDSTEVDSYSALYYAEKAIEGRLKAPSTAEFGGIRYSDIRQEGDTFYVKSIVDSQNGFGAMIRSQFEVRVIFGGDKIQTRILNFE